MSTHQGAMTGIEWGTETRFATAALRRSYDVVLGKMLQPAPAAPTDVELPYLKSASVTWAGIAFDPETTMWSSRRDARMLALKHGDLMVCEGGDVGRCAIYDGPDHVIFQNSVHRIRSAGSDMRFLKYVLAAVHVSGFLDVLCNKATIRHLTGEKLGAITIPTPPVDEQRRIADFLDAETARIDLMIRNREQVRAIVSERRDTLFAEALRERTGVELSTLDLDDGTTPIRPLSQVLRQLTNGYVGPTRDLLVDEGTRYIQSLHIKLGRVDFDRHPYFVPPGWAAERPRIRLSAGDVLIVQTGAVGQVAIVDEQTAGASCHALLIARTHRSLMSPEYLFHALRSSWGKQALEREQTGALHPHLEAGKVREIRVPVPSLDIQQQIAAVCADGERRTLSIERALTQQIALMTERRQALITAAVTGQLSLP